LPRKIAQGGNLVQKGQVPGGGGEKKGERTSEKRNKRGGRKTSTLGILGKAYVIEKKKSGGERRNSGQSEELRRKAPSQKVQKFKKEAGSLGQKWGGGVPGKRKARSLPPNSLSKKKHWGYGGKK